MKTLPSDPTMPCKYLSIDEEDGESVAFNVFNQGLTKREYFAAMAMQAVLSTHGEDYPEIIAVRALRYADALINELNKEDEKA
jgi:hypothetical protein